MMFGDLTTSENPSEAKQPPLPPVLVGCGIILLILLVIAWPFIFMILSNRLFNDLVVETISPDNKLKAVTFYRHCPNTPGTTEVSVISKDDSLPNEPGNVYRSISDPEIAARWLDAKNLRVSEEQHLGVQLRVSDILGVHVTYE